MEILTPFVAILALSFTIEAMVEYFIGAPFARWAPGYSWLLIYIAYLVALAGVITYRLDILYTWFGLGDTWTWYGLLISAAMTGRGSNWLHDFASRYLAQQEELPK